MKRKLSAAEIRLIRRDRSARGSNWLDNYSIGGLPKELNKPIPVTKVKLKCLEEDEKCG